MFPWVKELKEAIRRLWQQEPLLTLVAGLLLLRLLIHVDDFLTIRDLDFLPHDLTPHFHWSYRGGRPLTLFLNKIWLNILGPDPLVAKVLVGRIAALLLAPVTILLALRTKLSVRGQGVALVLTLACAPIFATYDSLGPYFLLTLCAAGQMVTLAQVVRNQATLVPLGMYSMVGLMVHRNALVTTAAAFLVVLWVRRRTLLRNAGDVIVTCGCIGLTVYRVVLSLTFDRVAADRQMTVYAEAIYRGEGGLAQLEDSARKLFSLLPDLVFAESGPWWLALILTVVFALAMRAARKHISRPLWWFVALGLTMSMALAILQEYVATDFFFRPNHGMYTLLWVPAACLLLAASTERWPTSLLRIVVAILVTWNLLHGYRFRGEAVDVNNYQLRRSPPIGGQRTIQFPTFVASIYGILPQGAVDDGSIQMERTSNDFMSMAGTEGFVVDVFEYIELGEPMYRFHEYERALETWTLRQGFVVRTENLSTIHRYLVLRPVEEIPPEPYEPDPR
jgi:hypothetical protein